MIKKTFTFDEVVSFVSKALVHGSIIGAASVITYTFIYHVLYDLAAKAVDRWM